MSFPEPVRTLSVRCGVAILVMTGLVAACAPAPENSKAPQQPPAAYPAQPAPMPGSSQPTYSQPGYPQPGQLPAPAPGPSPDDDLGKKMKSPEDALKALDEAEEELQLAFGAGTKSTALAGRCVRSCKALGSMRRAVDRLCDLTDGDERCENARLRLERSKQKVNDAGCSC